MVQLVQMRGWRRPAIGGNNAVVDDWGEGKCPDMPDVIKPRNVKVLDEGLFVRVIAVRSRKRSVIDVVSPCRRNTARNGILRTHPISRRTHLRMRAVRELALEVESDIFADPVATPQPARSMHEGIARSRRPYGEKRVSGSIGRPAVVTCESSDNVGLDSCVVWR